MCILFCAKGQRPKAIIAKGQKPKANSYYPHNSFLFTFDQFKFFHMKKLTGDLITFKLKPNRNGENIATLYVHPQEAQTHNAVLYIHGFNDYFFQEHMADRFSSWGIRFFALDLRRYGRSLQSHQKPNATHDLSEYFEEITLALDHIEKAGYSKIILLGHSTGGLISAAYCTQFSNRVKLQALILNSPFLSFNLNALSRLMLPLIACLGHFFPNLPSPAGLKSGYGQSVHHQYFGEWDFDLKIKPIEGYKVDLGWVSAIYRTQRKVRHRKIQLPVLVMHAEKSVAPGDFTEEMKTADSVLNVQDIHRLARKLGTDITTRIIANGMHDLVLSNEKAREDTFSTMENFVRQRTHLFT
jgi:alpha-beta hydrolase superfamily lysophospholipase